MRSRRHSSLICFAFVCSAFGCSRRANETEHEPRTPSGIASVYVVNYPLQFFAERIGGEHVSVVLPIPQDQDPAYWMPSSVVIARFQQADLILLNGASYDKWTRTVSLPQSRLVNTTKLIRDQYVKVQGAVTHTHGPGGEHSHHGTAFTTWLDPMLAIAQADAIRSALIELRPRHEQDFDQGFTRLKNDLQDLDASMAHAVRAHPHRPVFFSHPVYQYLIRRYKLNAKFVHWEPAEMPTDRMWQELSSMRNGHPASWMIWEAAPSGEIAQRLEALGISSVVFDPCGNVPEQGDYLLAMQRNIENLARVYATGESAP